MIWLKKRTKIYQGTESEQAVGYNEAAIGDELKRDGRTGETDEPQVLDSEDEAAPRDKKLIKVNLLPASKQESSGLLDRLFGKKTSKKKR